MGCVSVRQVLQHYHRLRFSIAKKVTTKRGEQMRSDSPMAYSFQFIQNNRGVSKKVYIIIAQLTQSVKCYAQSKRERNL